MALNDIYRVTHAMRYNPTDKILFNVYYYKQVTPAVNEGAEQLVLAWNTQFNAAIKAIQSQEISWLQVEAQNIVPSADFFVGPYNPLIDIGTRSQECLPPFVCWSFRLNRATTASRNGQKRIPGVAEEDQNDGEAVPTIEPALNTLAALFDDVIGGPPPGNATYQPVIFRVGKPAKTIPAKTIPAVIQADFDIASSVFVSVGSQNTRKTNT